VFRTVVPTLAFHFALLYSIERSRIGKLRKGGGGSKLPGEKRK
jgi:hypothetical protein